MSVQQSQLHVSGIYLNIYPQLTSCLAVDGGQSSRFKVYTVNVANSDLVDKVNKVLCFYLQTCMIMKYQLSNIIDMRSSTIIHV